MKKKKTTKKQKKQKNKKNKKKKTKKQTNRKTKKQRTSEQLCVVFFRLSREKCFKYTCHLKIYVTVYLIHKTNHA